MDLEEAATRLHNMRGFYNALGALEDIIATARSVDNIQNLAAERMAQAEKAKKELEAAKAELFSFRSASDKEMNSLRDQIAALKEDFRRSGIDLANDLDGKRMQLASELRSLQEAHAKTVSGMSTEVSELMSKRDDMQKQCDAVEKQLDALRKKLKSLLGDSA